MLSSIVNAFSPWKRLYFEWCDFSGDLIFQKSIPRKIHGNDDDDGTQRNLSKKHNMFPLIYADNSILEKNVAQVIIS